MMPESISDLEVFELSLRNFLRWLEIMSMDPVELCNTWGNYNVAWELITDLKTDGSAILNTPCSYLTRYQKQKVMNFLGSLEKIPGALLISAVSVNANREAMSDPVWVSYREAAAALLRVLDSAATRNRAYFDSDRG